MNKTLTARDFKMTRRTADKILLWMTSDERAAAVFHRAIVRFRSGKRERFCLFFDGHKIRNAAEWHAFNTNGGLMRASLARLERLTNGSTP